MANHTFLKESAKAIIAVSLIFVFPVLILAQGEYEGPVSNTPGNQGYARNSGASKKKKGTVIFGENASPSSYNETSDEWEDKLSSLQKEARAYRRQGREYQRQGDLDAAMTAYQKAIIVDSAYAVAYNDLGVIYEVRGLADRAQEAYLKAIQINPGYLSAYSNLALLYETGRDLEKAAFYWEQRVELGDPEDPWTDKARQRLSDIRAVLSSTIGAYADNEDLMSTLKNTLKEKEELRSSNANLAKDYFIKAQRVFAKGDDITAFKLALDALQLDPTNAEIAAFLEKVQTRSLSK